MNFDLQAMLSAFPILIKYIPITILMAVVSMIFAIVIGYVIAILTKNKTPVIYQLASLYSSFFRGTPTLVQLFLIYYGLPQLFPSFSALDSLTAAIIGLSLKNSAYLAEIFRAALASVEKGQMEACLSVGMTRAQAFRRIILPQATRNAIPATGNQFIALVKETSLAFTLGVAELFAEGKMIATASLKFFETYSAIAIVYWVLTIIYSLLQELLERKINKPYTS
ncbi:amino acid ABC transporter permease [Paenibacillus doosanensis]|uniref:Amino-acid permease protein YxeN n=1 Tax=Paenibacillus konkukensis TaxID=2020716 RepID=A0ABY4RK32_9BACL|nr:MULTISPECIES: amino acid ABC transporter permease [Paenibacillus]MCS7464587.1 amino acid ABC transporter permease [Paenibacillus doosanensis]UQZ82226.1 putative amino-acid permease protein YxeN [Paenibacillus konkukensis]